MIKIEAVWLACEPLDMRAGTESALARVVNVDAVVQHDGGHGRAGLEAQADQLLLEPALVLPPLAPGRVLLTLHGVHHLHEAHTSKRVCA